MNPRFRDRVREERARATIEQTLVVLAETGYDGFRVDEVARRVGVGKGTVYLDFPGKEALIDSALESAGRQLVDRVSGAIEDERDPVARILKAFRALAEILHRRRELAVLVECRPVRGPLEDGPLPCTPLKEFLQGMVLEASGDKALRTAEGEITAEAILGLLSRPDWRRMAAEAGPEEALRRSGFSEVLRSAPG